MGTNGKGERLTSFEIKVNALRVAVDSHAQAVGWGGLGGVGRCGVGGGVGRRGKGEGCRVGWGRGGGNARI